MVPWSVLEKNTSLFRSCWYSPCSPVSQRLDQRLTLARSGRNPRPSERRNLRVQARMVPGRATEPMFGIKRRSTHKETIPGMVSRWADNSCLYTKCWAPGLTRVAYIGEKETRSLPRQFCRPGAFHILPIYWIHPREKKETHTRHARKLVSERWPPS